MPPRQLFSVPASSAAFSMFLMLALCAGILLFAPSASPAQERRIPEAKLPAAVKASFVKSWPKAAIKRVTMEKEKGMMMYEITSDDAGTLRELLYKADGTLMETEETIPTSDFPQAALEYCKTSKPGWTIERTERITGDRGETYEAHLRKGTRERELKFDNSGALMLKQK